MILSVDDTGRASRPMTSTPSFSQFFTTKERGRGTGLGLENLQRRGDRAPRSHRGRQPRLGRCSFRVILPRLREPDRRSTHVRPPPSRPPPSRWRFDRSSSSTTTTSSRVRCDARSSHTACAPPPPLPRPRWQCSIPSYSPHLVLCDLGLPGTGDVLHARIAAKRPHVAEHFVFVTGGACSEREADYLRSSGCATLLKPVDIKDIWAALAAPHPRASVTPRAWPPPLGSPRWSSPVGISDPASV